MPELTLTQISRQYGPVQALDGVSLTLRGGEVHALMGENGAGKSTLIRLLAGLERPDSGQMALDGRPLRLTGPQDAGAAGLRFIHQELNVVPGLSVAENMGLHLPFPRRWGLVHWRALRAQAKVALARLGLGHIDPAGAMADLAPGDRMLTRIAATLIPDGARAPWAYVMDEPSAALTGAEAARLFAVIAELTASGAAVLYVSHRMAEVLALAARVSVLRDGRLVSSRARVEVTEAGLIAEMTGRPARDLFPPRGVGAGLHAERPPQDAPGLCRRHCLSDQWRTMATPGYLETKNGVGAPEQQETGWSRRLTTGLTVDGLAAAGLGPLSLTVAPGEVVALAGLQGGGCGMVLRALIGAVPRAGRVVLDGGLVPGDPAGAWAAGIAYVPPERRAEGLMLARAVVENASLPHLAGLWQRRQAEAARLEQVGQEVRLKAAGPGQVVGELSGGNQQKVLFARALAGRPRLLLLDEPTRGVDVGARADIYRLIRDAADAGAAVMFASSDLAEVAGLADRVLLMAQGRVMADLPGPGLTEAALLARLYQVAA